MPPGAASYHVNALWPGNSVGLRIHTIQQSGEAVQSIDAVHAIIPAGQGFEFVMTAEGGPKGFSCFCTALTF